MRNVIASLFLILVCSLNVKDDKAPPPPPPQEDSLSGTCPNFNCSVCGTYKCTGLCPGLCLACHCF